MSNKTKIIAVAGKGGVGKTSLAGVIVKLLVESFPDKKILAIDADPAVGLSTVLNVDVDKTIDDIRKEVIKMLRTVIPSQQLSFWERLSMKYTMH